ncbi:hypothetical protein CEXT_676491 [Caerostris extrusa]|uniref:Uncharacterized protein n=1 Tax=Caerostris extrusa TaxID=172846 RepID=A0AAV4Y3D9_CAEEX|nr:hypothetical protein CEXT_676491 [Caerostris extrusa]
MIWVRWLQEGTSGFFSYFVWTGCGAGDNGSKIRGLVEELNNLISFFIELLKCWCEADALTSFYSKTPLGVDGARGESGTSGSLVGEKEHLLFPYFVLTGGGGGGKVTMMSQDSWFGLRTA